MRGAQRGRLVPDYSRSRRSVQNVTAEDLVKTIPDECRSSTTLPFS